MVENKQGESSTKGAKRKIDDMTKSEKPDVEQMSKLKLEEPQNKENDPNPKQTVPVRSALHKWSFDRNDKKSAYIGKRQKSFAFLNGPKSSQEESKKSEEKNYKNDILQELNKLMDMYQAAGDKGKVMGYRRAITNIKAFKKPITSAEQMDQIPFVGEGIKKKVAEFIEQGKMTKLEHLKEDSRLKALDTLGKVWGIGNAVAEKLYASGITTIQELRDRVKETPDILNRNQKVGLKYFEDFVERMPREEAGQIADVVEKETKSLFGDMVLVVPCGSYRRGKATCGDVDCLITRQDNKSVSGMLVPLIESLEKKGFLKERLSITDKDSGYQSYMGVCKLEGKEKARRIDIKVYPKQQYGFALLYFTGSDYFNRSMRLFADKKGFSLSDRGLVPSAKFNQSKVKGNMSIPCSTEEEVFKALGIPFRSPQEREI